VKWYVYILRSLKDRNLYIGLTSNLSKRVEQHNKGHERTTRSRRPFNLLHYEEFASRSAAREREKYFKSGFGRELIKKLF
jgi:putative endonuclease